MYKRINKHVELHKEVNKMTSNIKLMQYTHILMQSFKSRSLCLTGTFIQLFPALKEQAITSFQDNGKKTYAN